jgi:hypothetical protein
MISRSIPPIAGIMIAPYPHRTAYLAFFRAFVMLQPAPLTASLAVFLALLAASAGSAQTQNPRGAAGGVDREKMWFAPTAEDWKKPCLVHWQRTWEDALSVSEQSGRAILICVNMDGEIASEHYAGVRYRQPDIAKLYEPYVCVIASVYRHTPNDFDAEGRRIECPRFGTVTCGEHIAIEPLLHDKFFEGKRIAPRHIKIDRGADEAYDVYYAFDTDSVFQAVREGAPDVPFPDPSLRGDLTPLDRIGSRDVADREIVEQTFRAGDSQVRRALIERSRGMREITPVDLLRQAIFSGDADLASAARRVLAETDDPAAVELLNDALRLPMEHGEREALVAALVRLAAESPRAQTLAAVHQGLSSRSVAIDLESWAKALAAAEAPVPDPAIDEYRLSNQAAAAAAEYPSAKLELAESCLSRSREDGTEEKFRRLLWQDARSLALDAERAGVRGARTDSVVALAAWFLGDVDEAHRRAEVAVKGIVGNESLALGETAFQVLQLFAHARRQAIMKAMRRKEKWPAEWLTDLHSTYSVMARHPLGSDAQIAAHYDFLKWLGGTGPANAMLDDGLARFPESWELHARFRARVLAERGIEHLEDAYTTLAERHPDWRNIEWFAGYAAITVAEQARRSGDLEGALAAYDRAIAHYGRSAAQNPDTQSNSDHYAAVALGAKARVELERNDLARAVEFLCASFQRKPEAAATLDGLNLSASDTSRTLRSRLRDAGQDALLARLEAELAKLDPELLKLPAYERPPGG